MELNFENYFYDFELLKKDTKLYVSEKEGNIVSVLRCFERIPGVKEVTIEFKFSKYDEKHLIYQEYFVAGSSRNIGYSLSGNVHNYVRTAMSRIFSPFRVSIFDEEGNITLGDIGDRMPIVSKKEPEHFFDDLELLVSYKPLSQSTEKFLLDTVDHRSKYPRFNMYYSKRMKKIIYEYPELLKFSKNIDEEKIKLIIDKSFPFLSRFNTSPKKTQFFLTSVGLYLAMDYDFESIKQFNLFEIDTFDYQKESVVRFLYSPNNNFGKYSNCLLKIADMFKETYIFLDSSLPDKNVILDFDKKFFIKVLDGEKIKKISGFTFHSDKIFNVNTSSFKKGDFVSIKTTNTLVYGKYLEKVTNSTSLVMLFSDVIIVEEVNDSVIFKSDDVFVPFEKNVFAAYQTKSNSFLFGKVIEENSNFYRILLPILDSKIDSFYNLFYKFNPYKHRKDELVDEIETMLRDEYKGFLFTVRKSVFKTNKGLLISDEKADFIEGTISKGLPSSEMFSVVFKGLHIYNASYPLLNFLCHLYKEKFGIEKAVILLLEANLPKTNFYDKNFNILFKKMFKDVFEDDIFENYN